MKRIAIACLIVLAPSLVCAQQQAMAPSPQEQVKALLQMLQEQSSKNFELRMAANRQLEEADRWRTEAVKASQEAAKAHDEIAKMKAVPPQKGK